jgi:hypothetical protein
MNARAHVRTVPFVAIALAILSRHPAARPTHGSTPEATLAKYQCGPQAEAASKEIAAAGKLSPPRIKKQVPVSLSSECAKRIQGEATVQVRLLINKRGIPVCAEVWKTTTEDPEIKAICIEAAMKFTFDTTTTQQGDPMWCFYVVPFILRAK